MTTLAPSPSEPRKTNEPMQMNWDSIKQNSTLNFKSMLKGSLILLISVLFCEYGYYYFIFHCLCPGWPGPEQSKQLQDVAIDAQVEPLVRILFIADTHIMGPIKSARIDKLRREWQMKQAFSISNSIYKPDVIVYMGDILDEGSFTRDDLFNQASDDFERIFKHDRANQQRVFIVGNHDAGFHNQIKLFPYTLQRFVTRYRATTTVDLVDAQKLGAIKMVAINSMSFYNDTCNICSKSISDTNLVAKELERQSIRPILLTHIPLYRHNDSLCEYPRSLTEKVAKPNVEGQDVLHAQASEFILNKLKPRLVISGHTHMECSSSHEITDLPNTHVNELTISSYNHKYAELKPGYLLLTANSTHLYTRQCGLVEEWLIASIYIAALLAILMIVIKDHHVYRRRFRLDSSRDAILDEDKDTHTSM